MEEKTLYSAHPSGAALIPHFLLMCVGIGFFTIWKPLFQIMSTRICVTNKRVEGKKGIIHTETMDSPISQITSVKATQGLFGKMCNFGTIIINTASGMYVFEYISNPEEVRRIISSAASDN